MLMCLMASRAPLLGGALKSQPDEFRPDALARIQRHLFWLQVLCGISTTCVLLITINLYFTGSLLGTTVDKANTILDEAQATGILPLVKDLTERIRTEGNATATVVIAAAQQTSSLLLAYTQAIGTVNATEQVQRVRAEVEAFLTFIDAVVRQRSVSIVLR